MTTVAAKQVYHFGGFRNVIVFGKTGSGKSTLVKAIVCNDVLKGIAGIGFSVDYKSTVEVVNIEGKSYEISIIDTPGLEMTDDSKIITEIMRRLQIFVYKGLHLIIFVYKHDEFTSQEEQKIFKRISDNLAEIQEFSLLVITNCDRKSQEARENIIKQFKEDPLTKKFSAMMKKGIYCVGLSDTKDNNEQDVPAVMDEMNNDIIPIHKVIAEAGKNYWRGPPKFGGDCIIL